jgi:hypothetical protein
MRANLAIENVCGFKNSKNLPKDNFLPQKLKTNNRTTFIASG